MINLKVIHLVRDPRAIIRSRWLGGWLKWTNLESESKNLCTAMETDLQLADILPSDRWALENQWSQYFYQDNHHQVPQDQVRKSRPATI